MSLLDGGSLAMASRVEARPSSFESAAESIGGLMQCDIRCVYMIV